MKFGLDFALVLVDFPLPYLGFTRNILLFPYSIDLLLFFLMLLLQCESNIFMSISLFTRHMIDVTHACSIGSLDRCDATWALFELFYARAEVTE